MDQPDCKSLASKCVHVIKKASSLGSQAQMCMGARKVILMSTEGQGHGKGTGEDWVAHTPSEDGSSVSKIIRCFPGQVKNTIFNAKYSYF